MRIIDADELYDVLTKTLGKIDSMSGSVAVNCVQWEISKQPTVDAAPMVHGKWIYNTDDSYPKIRCSCCNYNKPMIASDGGIPMVFSLPKYCEMCGALMDGKAK